MVGPNAARNLPRALPRHDRPCRARQPRRDASRQRAGARAAGWGPEHACLIGVLLAGGAHAAPQPARPPAGDAKAIKALRIDSPIELDGVLDEAAWSEAEGAADFVQQEPSVDQPPSERTEVRVLLDDDALYLGVVCADSEPAGIIARELRRDNALANDDRFEVVLDTFHDHRNGYHFAINPLGTQYDAQITDEGQDVNVEWDERWDAEARIGERGWTAEIRIPLAALRSRRGGEVFGINFRRFIRRKNEIAQWSGWDRDFTFLQVSQAGLLTGLAGVRTGLKLRVKPYGLGGFRDGGSPEPGSRRLSEAGLEVVKFSLTPALTAELTFNTDFAQTEVDEAVVNLTRFPTFYPEKREFFLERAGIFEFGLGGRRGGGVERNLQMFFSRRIGLTDDRREVPLLAGAKLIGRAAGVDLGLLTAQTDDFQGRRGSNYTVLRAKRNVLARSNVGAFFSGRHTSGADGNQVAGADVNLTLFKNTDIQGFLGRSFTPGRDGNSWVGRAKYNWYTDVYEAFLEHLYIGPEFQHDLGYLRRRDIRRTDAAFIWEPRPRPLAGTVRNFVFRGELVYTSDVGGRLLTREQIFQATSRFQSDDALRFNTTATLDRIDARFALAEGVSVPAGEYGYRESFVEAEGSGKRKLGGRLRYGFGDFYSGRRRYWQATPTLRPSPHFSLEASYERNDVSLPQGAFVSNVVNGRLNVNLSNRWLTSTLVQHDSAADRTVLYFRLNYIYRPGDDLFVVYSESRLPGPAQTDRALRVKLTRSFDFR